MDFARGLHELGVQLLSTGGTAATLVDAGLPVRQISEHKASPEMLDGRVKTLHPKVFGGILARRDDDSQMAELGVHKVLPIDLVAVNLYPFAATVARPQHTVQEALEQIDIGGVTLLRAAAKNSPGVVVVVDPANYDEVLDAVCSNDLPLSRRLVWAARAIAHTASYEASICNYLSGLPENAALDATPELQDVPDTVAMTFDRVQGLRYGENPHQKAAFFADEATVPRSLGAAEQLQGKAIDHRADIYAWGVTAYELLTHCKPFAGRNPDESLRNQLNGEFYVKPVHLQNSEVPVALTRLIHKCFAYLPEDRFPNMTILNAQLHKMLGVQHLPITPTFSSEMLLPKPLAG